MGSVEYATIGVNAKQPLSNNFINRSLQGGLPTQADSISVGQAAQQAANQGAADLGGGAETIQTSQPTALQDENGVSLTNLLTNIKVQRPP